MFLLRLTGLLIPLLIMACAYAVCRSRVCLKIAKGFLLLMLLTSAIGVILTLAFTFDQHNIWYVRGTFLLWLPLIALLAISVFASPVVMLFVIQESYKNWQVWKYLKGHYRAVSKFQSEWYDGNHFDVSSRSIVMSSIDVRLAQTDGGIKIAPAACLPDMPDDALAGLLFLPFWLIALARQLSFFLLFQTIEIPWSDITTSQNSNGSLILHLGEAKHELKLSPSASVPIKQKLLPSPE